MDFSAALFSPETANDPYPLFTAMRERAPVHRLEPHGWYAVSRFEDVAYVLKQHGLFSSDTGIERTRPPHLDEATWDQLANFRARSVINMDPPEHNRTRKIVSGAFTPRAITRLEARVKQISDELIDRILARDEFDMVADFAVPLPVIVIAEMLGVDPSRRDDFKRWTDDLLELGQLQRAPLSADETARLLRSNRELVEYFQALIAARREEPRDDLLSDLVRAEADEGSLTPEEVLAMAVLLLIAGNETTTNLIATGTHLLLDHPDQLELLRAEPERIPALLEEILRYEGPVTMLFRRTTEPVTLSGVEIPADTMVLPLVAAANRDPAHFPDPDRFDVRRETRPHVGFGHGVHFCVGAPLSRLEGKIAFEALLRRLPPFSRVDARPEWRSNSGLRGLKSLKVRFDRAAR